jgi:hypothetical protein
MNNFKYILYWFVILLGYLGAVVEFATNNLLGGGLALILVGTLQLNSDNVWEGIRKP